MPQNEDRTIEVTKDGKTSYTIALNDLRAAQAKGYIRTPPSGVTKPKINVEYDQSNPGSIQQPNSDPPEVARAKTFTPYGPIGLSYPGGQGQVFKSAPGQPMPTAADERNVGAGVGMTLAAPFAGGAEGIGLLGRMGLMGGASAAGGAATDVASGTPVRAKEVAGNAVEGAGAELAGSAIGAGFKSIKGMVSPPKLPAPEAARKIAQAVLPPAAEWPQFLKANEAEAENVLAYAKKNNLPMQSQLDYANAARKSAGEMDAHFKKNILAPHARETVNTNGMQTKYGGAKTPQGDANLGQIHQRIVAINKELSGAYSKRTSMQTMSALQSDADLKAEAGELTDILHNKLAEKTGLKADHIADLRQKVGKQFTIADQTEAAVNSRQREIGQRREGQSPGVSKTSLSHAAWTKIRGGQERIANRAFRQAITQVPTSAP